MQKAGFELIYADTDAVFLKKKDATREDFEMIMNELIKETGLGDDSRISLQILSITIYRSR